MKRMLVCLLLVGVVGCGESLSKQERIVELKKLGVHFLVPNEEGEPTQFAAAFNEEIDDAKLAYLEDMHHLEHILLQATDVSDAGLVHLKGLTSLKTLWLNETRITDVGLVHLKGLTNLEILQLPQSSKITDKGLMHLAGLTNLANLDLGRTSITDAGLVHLKGLKKLEMLALPKNITDAGLAKLKKVLPKLLTSRGGKQDPLPPAPPAKTYTQLPDIDVESLSDEVFQVLLKWCHDNSCPCLCKLSFAACRNDDSTCQVSIKTIREIVTRLNTEQIATTNEAIDFFNHFELPSTETEQEALAALKKLQALIRDEENGNVVSVTLRGPQITDAGLRHLKTLNELQILYLSSTQITDTGLEHLKGLNKLQSLNIIGPRITDAGLVHLETLINLETLRLNDTQVTDAGVAELQKALPDCKISY